MKKRMKTSAVALLALLLALALVACGDDGDNGTTNAGGEPTTNAGAEKPAEPDAPEVTEIVVRDDEPVGGIEQLEFAAGDTIRFIVSSNEADEVHVHGYDVEKEVPAGGSAFFVFPAELEGIYEVELHHAESQIAELRVNP
jgi:plastocyanin